MTNNDWFEHIYLQNYATLKKTAYYIILKKFGVQEWTWAEDSSQLNALIAAAGKLSVEQFEHLIAIAADLQK